MKRDKACLVVVVFPVRGERRAAAEGMWRLHVLFVLPHHSYADPLGEGGVFIIRGQKGPLRPMRQARGAMKHCA